ncbi:hypothetical protein [Pararhizobium sp. PWRC1-1]|uniref:hypothetical protein n=1 Tax=Pararhizobium sp. PWRC1-1 TaxID=2804566 RepID=UPI003CEBFBF1
MNKQLERLRRKQTEFSLIWSLRGWRLETTFLLKTILARSETTELHHVCDMSGGRLDEGNVLVPKVKPEIMVYFSCFNAARNVKSGIMYIHVWT